MFRFVFLVFSTLTFATASIAVSKNSVISECMKAIDASDKTMIQEQANEIIKWTNLFSDELFSNSSFITIIIGLFVCSKLVIVSLI